MPIFMSLFISAPFAALGGLTASQASSIILWVAAIVVPAMLFHHGRRQPPATRRVFVLVAVIAASLGFALALNALPVSESRLGVLLSTATSAIAIFAAALLLRRLPPGLATDRTIRGDELERLHLLEAAVTASGDGIMIAETTANPDDGPRIAFANPAFSRMMGYTAEETLGLSPTIFCHTDSAARRFGDSPPVRDPEVEAEVEALETIRQALRGAEPLQLEMPSRRKDGTRMWAEWQIVPVAGTEHHSAHWVAILRDTTERRRLESQLRETQKMDAIGRLAGGIAHDFNNLLTVVHGNAELLRKGTLDADSESELVDDISAASVRAAGLVRQLLTFCRRQPARLEVVDLNEIVKPMAGLLRRVLGEQVVVKTALAPTPVKTRADRSQIEQVVMNLAVNARDAMPKGGTLTIATSATTTRVPGGAISKSAKLLVSDTGTGMTPEVRAKIFEPFFTTKGQGKGTGLGLATVYGAVKQNGGAIGVDSAPGIGTAFRIELPWCDEQPCSSSSLCLPIVPPESERRVGFGRSILLVEDENTVRKMTRTALESFGYSVIEAECGEEAMELLEPAPSLDLLITDLTMPGMGGRELAARVKARLTDVGIVFISGYAPDASWLDDVPGAVFLAKPFTPNELLAAAGKAISRSAKRQHQPA